MFVVIFFSVKDTSSTLGVGEMEITPVSKAIARHLGIDLTSEGKAARNRRGIALIVNGAPQSGKVLHMNKLAYLCYDSLTFLIASKLSLQLVLCFVAALKSGPVHHP